MFELSRQAFIRFAGMLLAGPVLGQPDQELIDSYISATDRVTGALKAVKNVSTARSTRRELEDQIAIYVPLRDQVRKLAFDQRKSRNKAMQEAYVRLTDQVKRVREISDVERELHAALASLD